MKNMIEMNRLQQEAQRLREKEIQFNNMLQLYQEQIAELVDVVEQKVKEFTTSKSDIDETEQECVEVMDKEVTGLRERLTRTSQEAKEKLQQQNPAFSGLGMCHK